MPSVGEISRGREEESGPGGGDGWQPMLQEDLYILDGGDQPVLNLHPPQAPPAGPFETVMIGGVGEADFRQMLAALTVPPRGGAVRLLAGAIQ